MYVYHSEFQLERHPLRPRGSRLQPDTVLLTCALAALEKAAEWKAAGALLATWESLRGDFWEIFWGYGFEIRITS